MNSQTPTKPATVCNLANKDFSPTQPIYASSRDYGFDFDEEEAGRELLAPLPASLLSQATPEIDADEFESRHLWFLS